MIETAKGEKSRDLILSKVTTERKRNVRKYTRRLVSSSSRQTDEMRQREYQGNQRNWNERLLAHILGLAGILLLHRGAVDGNNVLLRQTRDDGVVPNQGLAERLLRVLIILVRRR